MYGAGSIASVKVTGRRRKLVGAERAACPTLATDSGIFD